MAHGLQDLNDDKETRPARPGGTHHGIIDLTLATPGAGPSCGRWQVVEDCLAHFGPRYDSTGMARFDYDG